MDSIYFLTSFGFWVHRIILVICVIVHPITKNIQWVQINPAHQTKKSVTVKPLYSSIKGIWWASGSPMAMKQSKSQYIT